MSYALNKFSPARGHKTFCGQYPFGKPPHYPQPAIAVFKGKRDPVLTYWCQLCLEGYLEYDRPARKLFPAHYEAWDQQAKKILDENPKNGLSLRKIQEVLSPGLR